MDSDIDSLGKLSSSVLSFRLKSLELNSVTEAQLAKLDRIVSAKFESGTGNAALAADYLLQVQQAAYTTGNLFLGKLLVKWAQHPPNHVPPIVRAYAVWLLVQSGFIDLSESLLMTCCESVAGREIVGNAGLSKFLAPDPHYRMTFDDAFQVSWGAATKHPWQEGSPTAASHCKEAISSFMQRLRTQNGEGWK